MADNLKLQQQINQLVEQRNKMFEEGEVIIQRQTKLYAALLDVMSGKKGAEAVDDMTKKLGSVKESMAAMADAAEQASTRTSSAFTTTDKDVEKMFGSTNKLTDFMRDKFPKTFMVAAGVVSGLGQGFRNIVAMGKALFGVFESVAEGAFSVAKAILSIPFKLFDTLLDRAQSGSGGAELMQAFEDVRKEFGSFKQDVAKNVIGTFHDMRGELAGTGLSVWRVLGNIADRLKYVTELAKGMGPTFHLLGASIAATGRSAKEAVAYQKGLGIAMEDMQGVGSRAITMGVGFSEELHGVANMSLQLGKTFGLSSKMISRDVSKMMKDVKNFGSLSVKEMTEMSVYSRKLGLDFEKLQGIVDKFDTFESAADSAAKLSQAFGVQINAFEMMKAQNPAERVDELRKAFSLAGKSAESMSRQELKLLEDATGLDAATAKQALSSKNFGKSLDEVRKASDAAGKKELTQTEIMKKLGDQIERIVMMGQHKDKGFFDAFFKGIERGVQASPDFFRLMYNIRWALLRVKLIGVELGRFLAHAMPGWTEMIGGLADIFQPKKFTSLFGNISKTVKSFFDKKGNFIGSFDEGMQALKKNFMDFFSLESESGQKTLNGFKNFMKFLASLAGQGIKWVIKQLTEGFKQLAEFMKDPKKYLDKALAAGKGGTGFMHEILTPLIEAVNDPKMWDDLWNAFKGFAGEFWVQAKKAFYFILGKIPADFWFGAAALFFGPAVVRGLLGKGTSLLLGSLGDMFLGVAKRAPGVAAEAAAGSGGVLTSFMGPLLGSPAVAIAAVAAALSAVGAAMSIGVDEFKGKIEEKVGKGDEALFGASSAGIIKTLSFGTISDEAAILMGVNLAKLAKEFEDKLRNTFGATFAGDMKEIFYSSMRTIIDLGDLARSIFKGDAKGVLSAVGMFTLDLFELFISSIKTVFVTIPTKLLAFIADLAGTIGDFLGGIFNEGGTNGQFLNSEFFKKAGKWVDRFGQYLVDGFIDLFSTFADRIIPGLWKFAVGLSTFLFKLPGWLVGGLAKAFDAFLGENNPVSNFLNNCKEALYTFGDFIGFMGQTIGDLVSKTLQYIKDKISGKNVDFTDVILSVGSFDKGFAKYRENLKKTTGKVIEANKEAAAAFGPPPPSTTFGPPLPPGGVHAPAAALDVMSTKQKMKDLVDLQKLTQDVAKKIESGGIEKSFNALVDMVAKVQKMNDAVTNMTKSPLEIKAKLQELATHLGLGANQTYKITNNGIEIKLDVNITMEAGKVEEVIVKRQDSKIRKAFADTGLKDQQSLNNHLGTPY